MTTPSPATFPSLKVGDVIDGYDTAQRARIPAGAVTRYDGLTVERRDGGPPGRLFVQIEARGGYPAGDWWCGDVGFHTILALPGQQPTQPTQPTPTDLERLAWCAANPERFRALVDAEMNQRC